ncbi:MAG: hypothetical protein SOW84_00005, partial [Candidatus Faecousia sp.]|nr:hypothetical protein [Candidatus Faecousia sp.]
QGVKLQLLSGDRKVSLADLNIDYIEADTDGFDISPVDSNGYFTITPTDEVVPGPIELYVWFWDSYECVPLKLKVKTQDVSFKLKTSKVTLNSDHRDLACIPVTITPADYEIPENWDGFEYKLTDSKGNEVSSNELDIIFEPGPGNSLLLGVLNKGNATPDATYTLQFGVKGCKMTTLTIKTLPKDKEVTVSAKASGAIDPTNATSAVQVKYSFKNLNNLAAELNSATITAYKAGDMVGTDVTDQFDFKPLLEDIRLEDLSPEQFLGLFERFFVCPEDDAEIDPSLTYKMTLSFELQDGTILSREVVLPVKHTPIKLKLSKTSLSLNKAVKDKAVLDLTCQTKGYELTDVVLPGAYTGDNAPLNVSFADGKLTVAVNSNTQYGETYKIPIQATKYDPAVTLTVKIPAEDKSAVTASLKAKGAIDTVRDGTFITVTPSYKNYMGLANINAKLTIESGDGKTYKAVDASLFSVVQNENGTFTIKKVPGESLDTSLKYRAKLTFDGGDPAYVNLSVKTGTGKYTVSGTPVLYKLDRFSHDTFTVTTKDTTLNEIEMVWFKNDAHAEMFWLQRTAPGEFAIFFRDSKIPTGKIPTSIPLYVWCEGGDKPAATVTVKLQVR